MSRLGLCSSLLFLLLVAPVLGKETPTVSTLVEGVRSEVRQLAAQGVWRQEWLNFKRRHSLPRLSYHDYLKATLLFEATRDAGLWHIVWEITDQEPNSDRIWAQWSKLSGPIPAITARAECDEISALYAYFARRLGLPGVGLFWPRSNHTVAVWKPGGGEGEPVRVVVPTTPIFLGRYDGWDARGFDPWSQAEIYDYTREDARLEQKLPKSLVALFLAQLARYRGASRPLLHELRYLRQAAWTGELDGTELEPLRRKYKSAADQRALKNFEMEYFR